MSFEFDFNADQVRELLKGNGETDEWFEAMEEILPFYEITTVNRVAGFIAQCAHESNNFRVLQENLNYSAKALDAIFGKYFVRAGRLEYVQTAATLDSASRNYRHSKRVSLQTA